LCSGDAGGGRTHSRHGRIKLLALLIEGLLRGEALWQQRCRARHFVLPERDGGPRLIQIRHALCDHLVGLQDHRLRMRQRGAQIGHVHARQYLALLHGVAFIDENVFHAGGEFRLDVDFVHFQTAVAGNNTRGQRCLTVRPPPRAAPGPTGDQNSHHGQVARRCTVPGNRRGGNGRRLKV